MPSQIDVQLDNWWAGHDNQGPLSAAFYGVCESILDILGKSPPSGPEWNRRETIKTAVDACWRGMYDDEIEQAEKDRDFFFGIILDSIRDTYQKSKKYVPKFKSLDIDISY